MAYKINEFMVRNAVVEIRSALSGKNFNHGEVLIALAETIGRHIVEVSKTPIDGTDAAKAVVDHMTLTMKVGYEQKGFNMGTLQ